ncbi:hypothetical protein [Rubrimonas cliftonensis]|uniref:hypothetical protein n=1 Tax=Rubrimonas cliftonensis TaxID=89524 RepID=UPI001114EBAB|nr:hypothetical protein [Rubrimonas cliftonensis]
MNITALNKTLRVASASPKDAELQAISKVSQLDRIEMAELIVSMTKKVSDQQEENDRLKLLAEKANQGLALWKVFTTASGAVLVFAGAVLWFGGLWSDWKAVRDVHRYVQPSGQVVFDHRGLSQVEIDALAQRILASDSFDLPEYALKSDIPLYFTAGDFVRFGQDVSIVREHGHTEYYLATDQPLSSSTNNNGYNGVAVAGARINWKIVRE